MPGKVGESLLIQAIRHEDGLAMPPKKPKLAEPTIADFETWVDAGAPDSSRADRRRPGPSPMQQAREHWAFQPVEKAGPPEVRRMRPG